MNFELWMIFILSIVAWSLWQGLKKKKGGDKD